MNTALLIAHRGNTKNFPENTFEAFKSAFDLGADGIECDVHLDDKQNVIIVHNYTFDRTQTYLTLEELIKTFSHRGRLEIEIKSFDPVCIEKISNLITQYNLSDYNLTSSILPLLPNIKAIIPTATTGMIFRSNLLEDWMTPDVVLLFLKGYLSLTKCNILHLDQDKYTPEIVEELHNQGYKLHSHLKTADKSLLNQARELGIDECTFDDVEILKL